MSAEPSEQVISTIAKLLAKAKSLESMGNVEEAALFSEKVTELLIENKLSMSDVELAAQNDTDPISRQMINPSKEGYCTKHQRIAWQETLAVTISHGFFCRLLIHPGSNYVSFVGRSSDRAVAVYLFTVLVREIDAMAAKEYSLAWRKEAKGGDVTRLRGFKQSFYVGAINEIQTRIYEKRRSMAARSERTTAIVKVADSAVDEWMKKNVTRKVDTPAMKLTNALGYQRGKEFGSQVNLTPNAIDSTNKAAKQLKG